LAQDKKKNVDNDSMALIAHYSATKDGVMMNQGYHSSTNKAPQILIPCYKYIFFLKHSSIVCYSKGKN